MSHVSPSAGGKAVLTRAEAAALMRVSVATIDRWRKRGILASTKSGGRNSTVRIAEDDLFALVEHLDG